MKLSVQLICALFICALFVLPLEAKVFSPNPAPDNVCAPPGTPLVTVLSSISAKITWTKPTGGGAVDYSWQVGLPGFIPGSGSLFSGTVTDTTALVPGLVGGTLFEVYVRANCPDNMFSDWIGPVAFRTFPGCDDFLFDSGGVLGNYSPNENTVTTICSDVPGQVVTLNFSQFVLAAGDSIRIFNGTSINDYLIKSYDNSSVAPFSHTSSDPSGCLTVQFTSDGDKEEAGYTAQATCAVPTGCFSVLEINVFNLTASSANFSWPPVFGALSYEWELENQQNGAVSSGSTLTNTLNIAGLGEGNTYTFRVRSVCDMNEKSDWKEIDFFTPIDCASKPQISCGVTYNSSLIGKGVWDTDACGSLLANPGRERVFRFKAPHTRRYKIQLTAGSATGNQYITYAYKESSTGCGPFDWKCIGDFLVSINTESTFGPLVAGKEYLILVDPRTTTGVTHSFKISECDPPNDEASTAVLLALNSSCTGSIYSNDQSTFNKYPDSLGVEPNPEAIPGDDSGPGRWLTGADETVWFKFKSPASGSVIISTESIPQNINFDTQLALYEAADSSKYNTFRLLASDDDNGSGGLGYNSTFSYSGLTPGAFYYIQVDAYGISKGVFCIQVTEGVERTDDAFCTNYFAVDVDGTLPDGDRWYDVYTRPDELDLGDMVIAVKPGQQDLDSVFARVAVTEDIPISINQIPHMPAYYSIRSSKAPEMPYLVRLFFHNSEFDSLVAKSGLDPAMTTIDQLVATHYTGPNEDCTQLNNTYLGSGTGTGVPTLITDINAVSMPASGMFYLELQVPGNGEIAVHLQQTVLPVELRSFTGKIADEHNRLEWVTETEKNVLAHILERSADGIHWNEINRQAGKSNSTSSAQYSYDDIRPLLKSYYRLKSVDYDGQFSLSSIVVLTRHDALGIDRIFPSPTTDRLNVQFSTPEEQDIFIRISDVTGKIVLEQSIFAPKGSQQTTLSLSDLPPGVYIVSLSDGNSVITPMRVVKQ